MRTLQLINLFANLLRFVCKIEFRTERITNETARSVVEGFLNTGDWILEKGVSIMKGYPEIVRECKHRPFDLSKKL